MSLRSAANGDGTRHDVALTRDGTTATRTADEKTVLGAAGGDRVPADRGVGVTL